MSDFKNIPSIDLADFTSGDAEKKAQFVKQLGEAYETIGGMFKDVKQDFIEHKLVGIKNPFTSNFHHPT